MKSKTGAPNIDLYFLYHNVSVVMENHLYLVVVVC